MRQLSRFHSVTVALALLVAPAAAACNAAAVVGDAALACGELGAMTSECPMSQDCCHVRSIAKPMRALFFKSVELLKVLEGTDLQVLAPLAPPAQASRSEPEDAFRQHAVDRYTLFSSFLL